MKKADIENFIQLAFLVFWWVKSIIFAVISIHCKRTCKAKSIHSSGTIILALTPQKITLSILSTHILQQWIYFSFQHNKII